MKTKHETLSRAIGQSALSPAGRERLENLLGEVDLDAWFETIDNSNYALADWLEALEAFDAWLTEQGITARPVASMLGYLECCTLTVAETLSAPEFAALVRDNLERYGFDATRPVESET